MGTEVSSSSRPVRAVAVFTGSSSGRDPAHLRLAAQVGAAFARQAITVVYGGAHVGLMGVVADAALAAGGTVVGVIPEALRVLEVAHTGLSELIVVDDMHARKREMYRRADACCALPGGFGTLEEVFEAITWTQLGLHEGSSAKPVVLLDPGGFWGPLSAFVDDAVAAGFIKDRNRSIVREARSIDEALLLLAR